LQPFLNDLYEYRRFILAAAMLAFIIWCVVSPYLRKKT